MVCLKYSHHYERGNENCPFCENNKLKAAMKQIAPYKDAIICYASTCSEYEGNRVAKAFDDALTESQ